MKKSEKEILKEHFGISRVRSRWDRSRRTVILATPPEKALTQQQFKDECDMNRIVKNAQRGVPPRFMTQGTPHYGDFSNVPDLTGMYEVIARAQEAFMSLPSGLRAELGNDPANINKLSADQIARYRLGKTVPAPQGDAQATPPASKEPKAPAARSKAGQAAPAGTEPADG